MNNPKELIEFYNENKNSIFVGYNSRQYDQFILKSILSGMNPGYVNDELISFGKKGFQVVKGANRYPLNNYDCILKDKSLKQLEAFMGDVIKESDVPFDIDRPLTDEEVKEIVAYNIHDVKETLRVLDFTIGDFEAQLDMIEMFDLDMSMFNKTKAQLASTILGAVQQHTLDDEFDITIPANLRMPEKYQYIIDWYLKPENKSYKLPLKTEKDTNASRQLVTTVAGVPCVFGYGGIHGSKDNEIFEGILVICDVASLYPALMINEGYVSRKLKRPEDFKNMRDRRIELKRVKDKRQQPLKIVINSAYGILKDRNSPCFDPLMSNNVCIAGQLYLTELAIRLGDVSEILQINTDGIYMRAESLEDVAIIKEIAREWEERTKLELEWDVFEHGKLVQKDVNNYLLIDKDTGKYKTKGAYVKKLSPIDNDLPILNKALVDYFVHDIPVEKTINEAECLIEFQKVIKLTNLYKGVVYGTGQKEKVNGKDRIMVKDGLPLKEKVHRVFASTRESDKGIYKVKIEKGVPSYEKVAYTPDRCFIFNDDVKEVKIPEYLDKQYYIDLANERIRQFLEKEEEKVDLTPQILFDCMQNSNSFYEFLIATKESGITKKVLISYLKADCCSLYGTVGKLLEFRDYFEMLYEKKSFNAANISKKISDESIKTIVTSNCELSKTGKQWTKFNYDNALLEIFKVLPDSEISPYEMMVAQIDKLKRVTYKDKSLETDRFFVLNVRDIIAPNIVVYNMRIGEYEYRKVKKDIYKILPLQEGDIIDVTAEVEEYGQKIIGKDNDGINILAADIAKVHRVISGYDLVYRNYKKGSKLASESEVA